MFMDRQALKDGYRQRNVAGADAGRKTAPVKKILDSKPPVFSGLESVCYHWAVISAI